MGIIGCPPHVHRCGIIIRKLQKLVNLVAYQINQNTAGMLPLEKPGFPRRRRQSVGRNAVHMENLTDHTAANQLPGIERGLIAHIEVSTRNFISLPRFFVAGMDGTAIINDWRDKTRVVLCRTWEEHDVKPVVTAAGLTKTMAPRDEKTTVTYEVERPESDVHDFYRNFVKAIDGEETQIVTHKQLMRVMKIMEAAFESDRVGAPIDFCDEV